MNSPYSALANALVSYPAWTRCLSAFPFVQSERICSCSYCQIGEEYRFRLCIQQVNDNSDDRCDYDPEQLKPVKKGDSCQLRVVKIVERGPAEHDKGDDEQQKDGLKLPLRSTSLQSFSPFVERRTKSRRNDKHRSRAARTTCYS